MIGIVDNKTMQEEIAALYGEGAAPGPDDLTAEESPSAPENNAGGVKPAASLSALDSKAYSKGVAEVTRIKSSETSKEGQGAPAGIKTEQDINEETARIIEAIKKSESIKNKTDLNRHKARIAQEIGCSPADVMACAPYVFKAARSGIEDLFKPYEISITRPDLKQLFEDMYGVFNGGLLFKDQDAYSTALTLWCMATWFIEDLDKVPYLMITAPEYGCGKTTALKFIYQFAKNAFPAISITPAGIFRIADEYHPTFLFDEMDTFFKTGDAIQMRGMINSGNEKELGIVTRHDVDPQTKKLVAEHFNCFGFKAFCGVYATGLAQSITERSIVIEMQKKSGEMDLKELGQYDAEIFRLCRDRMARFALDYGEIIKNRIYEIKAKKVLPKGLDSRSKDSWRVLFAIASFIDEEQHNTALTEKLKLISVRMDGHSKILSDEKQLLMDIRDKLEGYKAAWPERKTFTRAWLNSVIQEDKNLNWYDYNKGIKPIASRQIGDILRSYGIYFTKGEYEDPLNQGLRKKGLMGGNIEDFIKRLTEEIDRGKTPAAEPKADTRPAETEEAEPWDQDEPPYIDEEDYGYSQEWPPENVPF